MLNRGEVPRPRRTARPTSADLHGVVKAGSASEGDFVYTAVVAGVAGGKRTGRFCTATKLGDADGKNSRRPTGVLITAPRRGFAQNSIKRPSPLPSCIVALSGPVSIRVPTDVESSNDVENEVLELGHGCRIMPHERLQKRDGSGMRWKKDSRVNVILFDLLNGGEDDATAIAKTRTLTIPGGASSANTTGPPKKYRSMMSAHPFDVVCVVGSTEEIREGDLLVGILEQDSKKNKVCKYQCVGHRFKVRTAKADDQSSAIIGVAVSGVPRKRPGQALPVRVGGIVSLNKRSADLLTRDGAVNLSADESGIIARPAGDGKDKGTLVPGETYVLADNGRPGGVADGTGLHCTLQPIEFEAGSALNASVCHARLGTLSRY